MRLFAVRGKLILACESSRSSERFIAERWAIFRARPESRKAGGARRRDPTPPSIPQYKTYRTYNRTFHIPFNIKTVLVKCRLHLCAYSFICMVILTPEMWSLRFIGVLARQQVINVCFVFLASFAFVTLSVCWCLFVAKILYLYKLNYNVLWKIFEVKFVVAVIIVPW